MYCSYTYYNTWDHILRCGDVTWHFCNSVSTEPSIRHSLLFPESFISLLPLLPLMSVCLHFPQPVPVILLHRSAFTLLGLCLPEAQRLQVPGNYIFPGWLLANDWTVKDPHPQDRSNLLWVVCETLPEPLLDFSLPHSLLAFLLRICFRGSWPKTSLHLPLPSPFCLITEKFV